MATSYSTAAREVMGRYGYRIGIETDAEKFFVPADAVMVCVEAK